MSMQPTPQQRIDALQEEVEWLREENTSMSLLLRFLIKERLGGRLVLTPRDRMQVQDCKDLLLVRQTDPKNDSVVIGVGTAHAFEEEVPNES